jgi:hypothetical protein
MDRDKNSRRLLFRKSNYSFLIRRCDHDGCLRGEIAHPATSVTRNVAEK